MIDTNLISKLIKKDKQAFSKFYLLIVDSFFRYIKNTYKIADEDIDDIISLTFLKIWSKLSTFDKNKWNFEAWCWTILKNTIKDFFKRKKETYFYQINSSSDESFHIEDFVQDQSNIEDILETQTNYENITKALDSLSVSDREIIVLRFIEWKQLEEISNILWISYWNVRVKLHRSLNKLKKRLRNM